MALAISGPYNAWPRVSWPLAPARQWFCKKDRFPSTFNTCNVALQLPCVLELRFLNNVVFYPQDPHEI